jgi:bifunctional non-homologous end joining protein LigD
MDEKTTANSFKPMLANSRKKVPGGSDYIYEVKWDGIRAFVILNNEKIKIVSRSGRDITSQFPEFQKPDRFEIESGVFDSEIVVLDKEGKPQFHNVISRMHSKNGSNSKSKKATCYLFDALEVDGIDITGFPFMKRREILEATVKKDRRIRLSDVFTDGQLLFNAIESKSMEGIMAKKKNGKYAAGERSDNWLKIKCRTDDSAYIIGYTLGKGDRAGGIGALHLAKKHQDQWQYMGKVGTGFDTVKLKEVYELLEQLPTTDKPINETIEEPDRTVWVEAKYQCEITYASLSSNGTYREPVFKKLID